MDTQTFRASTMLEALQSVQKEMGPDAIVISMREMETGSGWQPWRKPCCEIVAARPVKRAAPPSAPHGTPAVQSVARSEPVQPGAYPAFQPRTSPAAAVKMPVEKLPAPAPKTGPREHSEGLKAAKPARPFVPQALPSRTNTKTWIAADDEVRPEIEAAAPKAQPAQVEKPFVPVEMDEPEMTTSLSRLCKLLCDQDLDAALVERMARTCKETLSPARLADAGYLSSFMKKQLQASLKSASFNLGEGHNLVCLIGASGTGKTSVCAKLAAHYALQEGKRVAWIEANTVRTGAISEARMICESFGVELYLVYTPEDLEEALARTKDADLVLVDTAGCNPRRESSLVELASMITRLPGRITLLVAPATTKESDLNAAMSAFRPFQVDGIAVTKMDEAVSLGSVYNLTWRSRVPVVCYSDSPKALDELSSADGRLLVNALLNEVN
jgi:flagellar biosynthesis protein FlhF